MTINGVLPRLPITAYQFNEVLPYQCDRGIFRGVGRVYLTCLQLKKQLAKGFLQKSIDCQLSTDTYYPNPLSTVNCQLSTAIA
jgi:hypothetical protein